LYIQVPRTTKSNFSVSVKLRRIIQCRPQPSPKIEISIHITPPPNTLRYMGTVPLYAAQRPRRHPSDQGLTVWQGPEGQGKHPSFDTWIHSSSEPPWLSPSRRPGDSTPPLKYSPSLRVHPFINRRLRWLRHPVSLSFEITFLS